MKAEAILLERTASAVATLLEKDVDQHKYNEITTQTIIIQQDSMNEINKSLTNIMKTLALHQQALTKVLEEFGEPKSDINKLLN
jgi:uncharacterized coiled-coil protein SlyX